MAKKMQSNSFELNFMLNQVIDRSSDFFGVADRKGHAVFVNKAGRDMLGIGTNQNISDTVMLDYIAPDNREQFQTEILDVALEQGHTEKTVFILNWQTNESIPVAMHFFTILDDDDRAIKYFMAFGKDLRNYIEAEKLRKLNAKVQTVAHIGGWELDIKTGKTTWTNEVYEIYGLDKDTPTNKIQGISFYAEHERPRLQKMIENCIHEGTGFQGEFAFYDARNVKKWVYATGDAVKGRNGEILAVVGTFQDVSERHEYVARQLESQRQLHRVITNTPGMVYQFRREPDGNMYFSYISPQGYEIYEMSREMVKQNPAAMLEAVHEEDAPELANKFEESYQKMTRFEWAGRIKTPAGKIKWVKARSVPQREPDGSVLWDGILIDMSSEKEAEIALEVQRNISLHNAKLASIGELAAGVGHEINNPLAIADGNVQMLMRELKKEKPDKARIENALNNYLMASERIKTIVTGLRCFSRADSDEMKTFDLVESIKQTTAMVKEIFHRDHIRLSVTLPKSPVYVFGSSGRIQQVLMNLLTNARDAMKDSKDKQILVELLTENNLAKICVGDTGTGISETYQKFVFDAFFTTKPIGEGTGLGLALSANIIKEHHGAVSFETSGKGTTFFITLPQATESQAETLDATMAAKSTGEPRTDLSAEKLRILVVDDESAIRDMLCDYFSEFNYDVTEAGNGIEALDALKKHSFDLILTDIKMPGMDGLTLISKIVEQKINTNTKIVTMTGGTNEQDMEKLNQAAKGQLLDTVTKPFSFEQIDEICKRVIANQSQI